MSNLKYKLTPEEKEAVIDSIERWNPEIDSTNYFCDGEPDRLSFGNEKERCIKYG